MISAFLVVCVKEEPHHHHNSRELGLYVGSVLLEQHLHSTIKPMCEFKPKNGLPDFVQPRCFSVYVAGGKLFYHEAQQGFPRLQRTADGRSTE